MTRSAIIAFSIALAAIGTSCKAGSKGQQAAALDKRAEEVKKRIAAVDESGSAQPVAKWLLPPILREVSGLALTSDGRVLAHNDERGRVYVIDPMRGVITKVFSIGNKGHVADFEAIAVSGADIYMLTSDGNIYQFREGDDGSSVEYTKHDTKLKKECEFEGLAVEPGTGAFLLPCKVISKKSERNQVLIYRWLQQSGAEPSVSKISVPLSEAIGGNGWKELSPSDMTIDPRTGNYIVITGREKALLEITPAGQLVRSLPLPGDPQQPEGVAITKDGLLMVSDEGVSRPADITIYRWREIAGAPVSNTSDTTSAATDTVSSNR